MAPHARSQDVLPDRHGRVLGQHRPDGRRARHHAEGIRGRDGGPLPRRRERPGRRARPLHPHDRSGPPGGRPRDAAPRLRQRRSLHGDLRGLVLPQRGFHPRLAADRGRQRHALRQPPLDRPAVALRAQLVLPPLGLPGAPGAVLRRAPRVGPAGVPPQRDARLHAPGPGGLLGQPRGRAVGHPVPHPRGWLVRAAARRLVGPGGGHGLRVVRRADQLHHRRRVPRRPGPLRAVVAGRRAHHRQGHQPPPHDRVAGHADERRPCRCRGWSGSTAGCSCRASG